MKIEIDREDLLAALLVGVIALELLALVVIVAMPHRDLVLIEPGQPDV